MASFPSPDRYDLAVLGSSVGLIVFAYLVYPTRLARVSAWFTIFTMYVCWMGYLAYRWTFDPTE